MSRDGLTGYEPHAPLRAGLCADAREAGVQICPHPGGQRHGIQPHQHHRPARKRLLQMEAGVAEDAQRDDLPGHRQLRPKAGRAAAAQNVQHPLHHAADPRRGRQQQPRRHRQIEAEVVAGRTGQEERPREGQIEQDEPRREPGGVPRPLPAVGSGYAEGGGRTFISKGQRPRSGGGQQGQRRHCRRSRAAHQPQRRTARPAQQSRRQQERRPHHEIHQKQHIEIDDRPHKPHPLFLG